MEYNLSALENEVDTGYNFDWASSGYPMKWKITKDTDTLSGYTII